MARSKETVTVVVVKIPFAILRALMATFNEARALLRPNGCGGSPVIVETRGGVETCSTQVAGKVANPMAARDGRRFRHDTCLMKRKCCCGPPSGHHRCYGPMPSPPVRATSQPCGSILQATRAIAVTTAWCNLRPQAATQLTFECLSAWYKLGAEFRGRAQLLEDSPSRTSRPHAHITPLSATP